MKGYDILLFDLKKEHRELWDEFQEKIKDIFFRADFIRGKEVKEFEEWLSQYMEGCYVVGCASGTDAITLALMSLDLPPDAHILVPAFTYIASAEPAALLGYKIIFVDVDEKTFTISIDDLREKITEQSRVIIAVHLYGQCANMEEVMKIAEEKGLYVIEDVAQSMGAKCRYKGDMRMAGTMGHFGCFSFFPTKNLGGWGDGGAIITKNKDLGGKARAIANHGQIEAKYYHHIVGMNSRLDTIQAALLLLKAKKLDERIRKKQEIASIYRHYLKDVEEIILPEEAEWSTHTYHLFTLRVKRKRDELMEYLKDKGIQSGVYYPLPLPYQEVFMRMGYKSECPVSQSLCKQVLSIPIHPYLTEDDIKKISDTIKEFFSKSYKS